MSDESKTVFSNLISKVSEEKIDINEFRKIFIEVISNVTITDNYFLCIINKLKSAYLEKRKDEFNCKCEFFRYLPEVFSEIMCFVSILLPCIMDRVLKFLECKIYESHQFYFFAIFSVLSLTIIYWLICKEIPSLRKKRKCIQIIIAKIDAELYSSIEDFKRDITSTL